MKNFTNHGFMLPLALILSLGILSSCESDEERSYRLAQEEQQRIEQQEERQRAEAERQARLEQERIEREARLEQERIEREAQLEKERKEKEIYDKYISNSLRTGATPYSYCFGTNKTCNEYGCSQISVKTPLSSDVIVTIKQNGKVVRHAYINGGFSYTFEVPNGTYQPFFYYGKGWNPDKVMKELDCGTLEGGFISAEHFGKDDSQHLSNNILEYELILQEHGNFSTRPSNQNEAF